MEYHLPGVFINNPLATEINGSLWTLQYEVCCYLALPVLIFLTLKRKYFLACLFVSLLLIKIFFPEQVDSFVLPFLGVDFRNFYDFFLYFLAGSLIYNFSQNIPLNITISIILVIVCCMIPSSLGKVFSFLALPYLVIVLGFLPAGYGATRMADVSYGMYLYGFPVQQIIKHVLPTISALNLLLLCIPATFVFALASRKFIEKPALGLKGYFTRSQRLNSTEV
jgi:peptidoglycan/LPS O-acetylase OafA/YrhL